MDESLLRSVPQAGGEQNHAWFIFWHFPLLPCLLMSVSGLRKGGAGEGGRVWEAKPVLAVCSRLLQEEGLDWWWGEDLHLIQAKKSIVLIRWSSVKMVIYKLQGKIHLLMLPLHITSLRVVREVYCVNFLPRKASVTSECTHAVLCLAYFDVNFIGERFKNKNKPKNKEFPSIQCESHVCELRVPLRASWHLRMAVCIARSCSHSSNPFQFYCVC